MPTATGRKPTFVIPSNLGGPGPEGSVGWAKSWKLPPMSSRDRQRLFRLRHPEYQRKYNDRRAACRQYAIGQQAVRDAQTLAAAEAARGVAPVAPVAAVATPPAPPRAVTPPQAVTAPILDPRRLLPPPTPRLTLRDMLAECGLRYVDYDAMIPAASAAGVTKPSGRTS